MNEKLKHCCHIMNAYAEKVKQTYAVEYEPDIRSYSLRLYKGKKYTAMVHQIWFCPWCGKELPKDLSDEMEETLEKEYSITSKDWDSPEWDDETDLPEEFKTNEWWKKRNL